MNKSQLKGQWSQIKGEVKRKWGLLTDDELMQVEGDYDKLVGKIRERYGESEQSVKDWIEKLGSETRH